VSEPTLLGGLWLHLMLLQLLLQPALAVATPALVAAAPVAGLALCLVLSNDVLHRQMISLPEIKTE